MAVTDSHLTVNKQNIFWSKIPLEGCLSFGKILMNFSGIMTLKTGATHQEVFSGTEKKRKKLCHIRGSDEYQGSQPSREHNTAKFRLSPPKFLESRLKTWKKTERLKEKKEKNIGRQMAIIEARHRQIVDIWRWTPPRWQVRWCHIE